MIGSVGVARLNRHVTCDIKIDVTQVGFGGRRITGITRIHTPANHVIGQAKAQRDRGGSVATGQCNGYAGRYDLGIDIG